MLSISSLVMGDLSLLNIMPFYLGKYPFLESYVLNIFKTFSKYVLWQSRIKRFDLSL